MPVALSSRSTLESSHRDEGASLACWAASKAPQHIGVVMDGNRRWAKQRHLPAAMGHRQGVLSLKKIVRFLSDHTQLQALSVYAFSSENWARSQEEVQFLFQLFSESIRNYIDELQEKQVRLRFIGDWETLSIAQELKAAEKATEAGTGLTLQVAINYGGRQDIVQSVRRLAVQVQQGQLMPEAINEAHLSQGLYNSDVPAVDMIIRPGGEQRLSNFLLWQAAYAELLFSPVLWPDFSPTTLTQLVSQFTQRDRRYGH